MAEASSQPVTYIRQAVYGTREQAEEIALLSNAKSGLALKRREKHDWATVLIKTRTNWPASKIARHVGLTPRSVLWQRRLRHVFADAARG